MFIDGVLSDCPKMKSFEKFWKENFNPRSGVVCEGYSVTKQPDSDTIFEAMERCT